MKKMILKRPKSQKLILIALITVLMVMGIAYWWYRTYYPSTDDAYVQANVVEIASQVSGPVTAIFVHDHQAVSKGQLLFTIDPKPFDYALAKAKANCQLAEQQMGAGESSVQTAQAQLQQSQAQLTVTEKNTYRTLTLARQGLLSRAEADNARAQLSVAKANVEAAASQLEQARQNLGQVGAQNAQIQQAKAALQQAMLDLQHTRIVAPNNGYLVNFVLRQGAYINAGDAQFSLVEDQVWWVDANFKETQLARIRPGQQADISLDIYPGVTFIGRVDAISAGSGAAFSLLPPENATGNWVKVTQRFPVKVWFIKPDNHYPLRVGASSTVTIDTRS